MRLVGQPLFQSWLYASRSTLTGDHDLRVVEIVERSRLKNSRLAITGALIFTGVFFAQYVEGPADSVESLKASILSDDRHTDVRTVATEFRAERRFSDWSLAYAGDAAAFGELIGLAHKRPGRAGQALLLEMIRRFMADGADG
jgi:hypothetical protein